jgi:hypothetical protein
MSTGEVSSRVDRRDSTKIYGGGHQLPDRDAITCVQEGDGGTITVIAVPA